MMTFDLRAALPVLLPKAIAWAQEREEEILNTGIPLTEYEISLAKRVGVSEPEKVRISIVDGQLPLPSDLVLRQAGLATGLFGPHMAGITLGHSICICRPHESIRLLSHELRHVHQYEQMGSIVAFLPVYLQQIVDYEYSNAPYEVDARRHEIYS